MTSTPNDAIIESWNLSLHDKSPATVSLYNRVIRWFAEWMVEAGRPDGAPGDLLAASRQDCEAWFAAQRSDGLKPATLRGRWIALRNFYGWAVEEDEIETSPMAKVKVAKPEAPKTPLLSDDDLKALLKVCAGTDFRSRRDAALIRLLAATGLRLSEAADLNLDDVDLVKRVAFVRHGKGDKARFVRFDAETAKALDRYKRARGRHAHAAQSALWLGRMGRFTANGIPIMLRRRAAEAGLAHIHAHQFRHGFADRFLANGGTEGDLMRLGGWESAEVMRRYGSAAADQRALDAYDAVMGT